MSIRVEHPGSPVKRGPGLAVVPTTRLGWWAVGLASAFFPLVFAAASVPRGAALGLLAGLAGGIAAVVAIVRDGERALTVVAALTPFVIAVGFGFAQLL